MAIYGKDATASTAVAAWLTQFKIAANGAITYVAGTDTFHVTWLHRALQKKVYEFASSGDDDVNLAKPNPSKSEALGTIITLYDHTADFGVNYTVSDEVMKYHFGGSVSQNNGDDEWYGLKVLGSKDASIPIKIIQNHTELTSHWGAGKNQTEPGTLLRVMIKGKSGGSLIDHGIVHVKLSTWGFNYAIWKTTLGLGEAIASVSSTADPQNDTALATVQAYGITKPEGYRLLDLDNNGNKPYLGEWSYAPQTSKKALYEYVKAILVDGSADTLYGVDGDLWTGRILDFTVDNTTGSGTFTQNEAVSWTGGTGNLVGMDDMDATAASRMFIHLNTGVAPPIGGTITGGSSSAAIDSSGAASELSTHPHHLGQFTGAWIGAHGIGFKAAEVTSADSFTDLDGNTVSPPNSVAISVNIDAVDAADDPHVFLAPKDPALNAPDIAVYTAASGNNSGNGTFTVNESIASDTPQTGHIGILATGDNNYEFYEYTSWSGSTFTLAGTLSQNITANDPAFHAIFYQSAIGTGTSKSVSNSLIYNSDIDVIGWVRQGDPAAPDKQVQISGTIGSGGMNINVNLERE